MPLFADMTGKNSNVFYEVGYAHAKNKTCVLLTQNTNDIPFDLKHHRHIVYNNSITTLKKSLSADLSSIKEKEIEKQKSLTVETKADLYGTLISKSYGAYGELEIVFDIHASKDAATEIESMYFYTGSNWTFVQDGLSCPYIASDMPDFKRRHMLKVPVRRLTKGAWTQIKIKGTRLLQSAKKEAQKSEYEIAGQVGIRICSPDRNFDFTTTLETTFSEIPF